MSPSQSVPLEHDGSHNTAPSAHSPGLASSVLPGSSILIAVLAAEHRLILLHYDADFEIAGQVISLD